MRLLLALLILMFPAPVFPQVNTDANFIKAAGCWGSPQSGHSDDSLCGIPKPVGWPWHLSWDQQAGTPFPQPLSGYLGSPVTRLRYAALAKGGMVFQINTADTIQYVNPWRYNFQAFQTNISQAIPLLTRETLNVEFDFKVRKDWFHYDVDDLSPKHTPGELGERRRPWIHLILGAVFSNGSQIWFIEIVPFYREGSYGSGLGKIHGDPSSPNARWKVSDPRIAAAVSNPNQYKLGQRRLLTIDFKKAFRKVFPNVGVQNVKYSGSYIGTEQFGKNKIAINFKRLAILN